MFQVEVVGNGESTFGGDREEIRSAGARFNWIKEPGSYQIRRIDGMWLVEKWDPEFRHQVYHSGSFTGAYRPYRLVDTFGARWVPEE
jgi:hypothetical protein